ncbi:hypothetical protein FACS1894178_4950 [Bacteroidia bacterium]|nr:hypothetical protein FACS1894178_4950 [Bacteroidia bacterium]
MMSFYTSMKKIIIVILIVCSHFLLLNAQSLNIALVKYRGGGDWYANPTSLTNLIAFCNQNLHVGINPNYQTVDIASADIFNYPFLHITGHGNIVLDNHDVENLRNYLLAGGFLHADDNYGLRDFFFREMKKVFPEIEAMEIAPNNPVFHQKYDFPNGLPKIHEHDNQRPQAFAWYLNGRMLALFTYECDLGDGWEDKNVHNDSDATRLKALQMGANIIKFAFEQ